MAINKVIYGNNTLIDLTGDTVTSSDHIMQGYIGHLADGTQVTGTGQGGSGGEAAEFLVTRCENTRALFAYKEIPASLTSIGDYAFYHCTDLALTSLPDGVTSIGIYAFAYCHDLALTSLPNGVTSIGEYAFRGCRNLALTSLPDGVTSIESGAFRECNKLALTSLPDGVTSIKSYAFRDCTGLTELTVPGSVTRIEIYGFYNCTGMKEYHFLSTTPPTLGNKNVFYNIPSDCKIYVPSDSLEAYQTASNWSNYASYMVGE